MIAALLLAAGAARRFGAPKLLEDLDGVPVVRWSAEWLRGAPVDEILVVVPPRDAEIRRALEGLDVRFVANARADLGMGTSIACGVSELAQNVEAAIVALADEPLVEHTALVRVVERYRAGGAAIVAPTYRGTRGHPVLFDRSTFDELRVLTGDRGARDVVDRDPQRVAFLELDAAKPIDIDRPEDLARLVRQRQYISPSTSQRP